jgi:release factor glutamine methyltransferase
MTLTVGQALQRSRDRGVERLDAQLLLAAATQCTRSWLIANHDASLTEPQAASFLAMLARRADDEPLAYILGEKEFHGLLLHVNPSVLVPRADTEVLVDWALDLLHGDLSGMPSPRVVDLGTGSGAIALAVKHACPRAGVTAVDDSAPALDVARHNAQRLGLELDLQQGHWWNAVTGGRFHLALANPPYIAEGDSHLHALRHEPSSALTSGADGLSALREIVSGAHARLEPEGWLLLEHGHDQAGPVQAELRAVGFAQVTSRCDLSGHTRCSGGRAAIR